LVRSSACSRATTPAWYASLILVRATVNASWNPSLSPMAARTSANRYRLPLAHRTHHAKPAAPAVVADLSQLRKDGLPWTKAHHPAPGGTVGIGVAVAVEVAGGRVVKVCSVIGSPGRICRAVAGPTCPRR